MTYSKLDVERSERDHPRMWLRIISERLSTIRYIFVVTIEDELPTVDQRAALEYADAVLLGWPQADSREVRNIPDQDLEAMAEDIESIESRVDSFRQSEKNSDSDAMADTLMRISELVANIRKAYQPDFLLPTYAEIRSFVEKEWNKDMDKLESDAQEYLNSQDTKPLADTDDHQEGKSHE
ncbi:protein [Scardovia inopinata]|uniref:Phosphoribosylglycinamide synthetase n=1 Tax=Scardovia inopinata F0304 TaxID=641146 RepID=W5IHL1_SCAIO|nr:hypothetical protein [Scardovia inopinata]EFG26348.1 hypothetical protein HMPREF9020_01433 [Scardovia inopinata F0304]SUV51088.1 protein [Scardovia inopinata]